MECQAPGLKLSIRDLGEKIAGWKGVHSREMMIVLNSFRVHIFEIGFLLACWQGYLMTTCLGKWSLLSVYVYMYLCVYEVMCEEVNMSSALLRIVIMCPLCTVLTAYMVMLEVLSCSPHVSAICERYLIPGEHTSNSTVEGGRMMSIRPISCYFLFHFNDKSQGAGWYRMCPFPIQSNNLNLMHMRC